MHLANSDMDDPHLNVYLSVHQNLGTAARAHRAHDFHFLFSKLDISRYGLLNSGDFFIPRYNTTTYGKHSLRYVGPVIWSKLSKDVKNVKSIHSF